MMPPNRLSELTQALEAGEEVTQERVDQIATLQVLDVATMDYEYVREIDERTREADERAADTVNGSD